MGKLKVALRFRRQKHVDKITVFVESDFAGDPASRKSTTGLVAQIGNHTVKSGSTLQSLAALSVGEAEFYAVTVRRRILGCMDWEQRTKHVDTRNFWIQERVQDGDFNVKKVLAAKNCTVVGTKPVSASVLQQHCKFAGLVFF